MSESNIQASDLIDTTENQAIEDEPKDEPKPSPEPVQVGDKSVKELTNEERSLLIANAKNGLENDFFKVAFDKHGRPRISKKKAPKQTTAAKIIEKRSPSMTTEQLLIEHVIGLESELSTLTQKHKNLKKKYKRMYEDVNIDDETFYNNTQESPTMSSASNTALKPEPVPDQKPQEVPTEPPPPQQQQQPKRYGWRARINPMF